MGESQRACMTDAEREAKLRETLAVPEAASADDILRILVGEGWTPHPYVADVEGRTLYFCPIHQGIFVAVERLNSTGEAVQTGWRTPELAALEALRKARFEPRVDDTD